MSAPKIYDWREPSSEEQRMSIQYINGPRDGEVFRTVFVKLEDGGEAAAWKSDTRPGFFKQVFVPFDFEHPAII